MICLLKYCEEVIWRGIFPWHLLFSCKICFTKKATKSSQTSRFMKRLSWHFLEECLKEHGITQHLLYWEFWRALSHCAMAFQGTFSLACQLHWIPFDSQPNVGSAELMLPSLWDIQHRHNLAQPRKPRQPVQALHANATAHYPNTKHCRVQVLFKIQCKDEWLIANPSHAQDSVDAFMTPIFPHWGVGKGLVCCCEGSEFL